MTRAARKVGDNMLKIGFDLRYLQEAYRNSTMGGLGGVGVYSRGLWSTLVRLYPEVEWIALVDYGAVPEPLFELIMRAPKNRIVPFGLSGRGPVFQRLERSRYVWMIRVLESEFGMGTSLDPDRIDVLHILNQSPAPALHVPTIVTLYDLIPLGAGESRSKSIVHKMQIQYLTRLGRADRLACISKSTQNDALQYLYVGKNKTRIVYPGIDLDTFHPGSADKEVIEKFGITTDYFIHAGVCSGRKNPSVLLKSIRIAAEAATDREFKFVFVGPYQVNQAAARELAENAKELGIGDRIVILGDVADKELAILYQYALALVFPSLYEGFGYPAVECLACGTQPIVSNTASLPEAVGKLGVLIDPKNPQEIADAMIRMLQDGKNEKIRVEGPRWASRFSWENAAKAYMNIYRELAGNRKSN